MSHRFHRYDSAANPVQPPWHCRKLSLSICANFFASDGICFAISPPGVSETSENELRGKNDQQVLLKRIRHMIFLPNHPKSFHEFLVHDCFRLLNLWESLVTLPACKYRLQGGPHLLHLRCRFFFFFLVHFFLYKSKVQRSSRFTTKQSHLVPALYGISCILRHQDSEKHWPIFCRCIIINDNDNQLIRDLGVE